jgi:hypothetical protein
MSLLKYVLERLFHWSNITHIANDYEKDIWVCFESSNLEIEGINTAVPIIEAERNRLININVNKVSNSGWTKIKSRKYHRYNRSSKTEKITIVCATTLREAQVAITNMTSDLLLLDYPVQQNFSYVLTKDGEFLQQKYGSNNLFQVFSGWCHYSGRKYSSTPPTSQTSVYLAVFFGAALCFCVFRHRIAGSTFFNSLKLKLKLK